MSVGSINTNASAYIALESLNNTSSALQATQKQISTGYRVSDATDDGGAFAVAQKVRSDVGALTSVNQQLGSAKGLVTTALSSLTSISNAVTSAKALLVKISDQSISDDQRNQYITSYKQLVKTVANNIDNSTYNGVDTISTVTASSAQTAALAALAVGAGFDTAQTGISNKLNQAGSDSNYLYAQITFNSDKIDSLNSGLGALVDADLSKESAILQSLQIKQQLGTQALSIANQSPQSLLSLFK